MAFVVVPDRAAGYAPQESDWDLIKDNMNAGTWVKLGDTIVGSSVAFISMLSVAQTFSNLLLLAYLRSTDGSANAATALLRFNSDTGSNYDWQRLSAAAASGGGGQTFGATSITLGTAPAGLAPAGVFLGLSLLIPAYRQTTGNKVAMAKATTKVGTSTSELEVRRTACFWRSSAAISDIELRPASGDWGTGSRVTLYGLA